MRLNPFEFQGAIVMQYGERYRSGQIYRGLACLCLLLAISLSAAASATAPSADLIDFDFVTAKVEANYSGWETKVAGTRRAELDTLTRQLREKVARSDDGSLRNALQTWIAWFDDGHLQLQWAVATVSAPWRAAPRPVNEAQALRRLAALGQQRATVEGLWTIDDRYRLAVLRQDTRANVFDAIVLSTTAQDWRPGQVKAVLSTRADGGFDIRYGAGDKTEVKFQGKLQGQGDVLDVGDFGIWRRAYDDPAQALAAQHRWPGDEFAILRLDADTLYLRLPSFGDQHTATVRKLMADHAEELMRTPNLIVDVRGNGGGSDFVYDPVLPYLYTRPIWRIGVEVRVSPDNMRLRAEVAKSLAAASPEAAGVLASESDRMKTATSPFIRREPPVEVVSLPAVSSMPERIAVLVDRAGSSAENFIMDARQSRKVVLMGQENSAGVIDFGEMMSMPAPSGRFALAWGTTRSLRLPNDPVDPHGIAPDVLIPGSVDDPVAYAARWLAATLP
jgi:hypothetical protein